MTNHVWAAFVQIQNAWDTVRSGMLSMYPSGTVYPQSAQEIFVSPPDVEGIKFDVRPMIFNLPERATHQSSDLFVAVSGWLEFDGPPFDDPYYRTKKFGTKVGYFRRKKSQLTHVFGAHYDLDEDSQGHPIFHGQLKPQMDMAEGIADRLGDHPDQCENFVKPILRNVRIPTAQMDVFALIIQLFADHLIHEDSGPEVMSAFEEVRTACSFFRGVGHRLSFLNSEEPAHCYRSMHWYSRDG